jgi:hypothetical protein
VSDKFAGKQGPCPKCKGTITIPKSGDQIKIHERAHEGVKDSKGKLILKPIERQQTEVSPIVLVLSLAGTLATILVAWVAAPDDPATVSELLLGIGAIALAPPLATLGYSFLRNDELEPYRGLAFIVRVAICSAIYALLWGAYYYIPEEMKGFNVEDETMWMAAFVLPPFFVGGAAAAFATLDLDFGSAFFHYSLYALACVLLRMLLGLPPI